MLATQNIIELVKKIEEQLKTRYQDETLCNQYAWWILENVTGKQKTTLIAEQSISLTNNQEQTVKKWIKQQVEDKIPLQYLLGSVPFGELEILVEPPVLIPRPETEEWCLQLIEKLKPLANQKLSILDLCTGTGCIALALAKALPKATVYGTDISDEALTLAEKNANHNKITNVRFIKSDLFQTMPAMKFDLIVTNPPYIAPTEWEQLDQAVVQWEDRKALVAGNQGLAIIQPIINQAPNFIKHNVLIQKKQIPQLIIEVGHTQADKVVELMKAAGYSNIEVQKDLEKKERVVTGSFPDVAIFTQKK